MSSFGQPVGRQQRLGGLQCIAWKSRTLVWHQVNCGVTTEPPLQPSACTLDRVPELFVLGLVKGDHATAAVSVRSLDCCAYYMGSHSLPCTGGTCFSLPSSQRHICLVCIWARGKPTHHTGHLGWGLNSTAMPTPRAPWGPPQSLSPCPVWLLPS